MEIRLALMIPPVAADWISMIRDRQRLENNLMYLLNRASNFTEADKTTLDSSLDRTHFYISYHGINDRFLQELVMETYRRIIRDIEWFPVSAAPARFSPAHLQEKKKAQPVRIGFISKFFGIFEPHGMLLDGIMK